MAIAEFRNTMIQLYGEAYFKFHSEEVFDERKYFGAKSSVGRWVLNTFYNGFVGVDIEPIETLSKEKKNFIGNYQRSSAPKKKK